MKVKLIKNIIFTKKYFIIINLNHAKFCSRRSRLPVPVTVSNYFYGYTKIDSCNG